MSIIIAACNPVMSLAEKLSVSAYWIQAIAACATLYLAYQVYERVLNQKVAEIRLGLILELIEIYQKNYYILSLNQKGYGKNPDNFSFNRQQFTLFDLASINYVAPGSDFDLQVIIPNGFIINFDKNPRTISTNPLFPAEISNLIMNFNAQIQKINISEINDARCIIMGEAAPNYASVVNFLDANTSFSFIGGFSSLVSHGTAIVAAIESWLMKNKIVPNNQSVKGSFSLEGWQILH